MEEITKYDALRIDQNSLLQNYEEYELERLESNDSKLDSTEFSLHKK